MNPISNLTVLYCYILYVDWIKLSVVKTFKGKRKYTAKDLLKKQWYLLFPKRQ